MFFIAGHIHKLRAVWRFSETEEMALEAGTSIGPYKLLSQIGCGGMGEVYLALDTRLGRNVALKFLSSEFTENAERVHRFQQEARAASKLNHPNLITIFDVGQVDSTHFIATEYIEGETLRQRMARAPLSMTEICDIAIQVANALAIAHSAGIMHRDIKPENIMIRPDGLVKVLDFGLAKLAEKSAQQEQYVDPSAPTKQVHTEFGMVMGTINYMSPEQARGMKVDSRTDIFSLGVVIYEMISGRVPFEGQSYGDVIAAILSKRPVTLTRYLPEIPAELERIVTKALAKDREERYQTIKDMLIDLKKLKQQLEQDVERDDAVPQNTAEFRSSSGSGAQAAGIARKQARKTEEMTAPQPTSSAEYIVNSIRRHKRGAMIVMAAVVVAAAGLFYFATRVRPIDSIAVLPFASVGDDPNTKRVCEAISQHLINDLSRLPGLKVKAYSSVARYAGQQVDPQSIGRELGVGAVVIGKIEKQDQSDNLSISFELVNARDGNVIWGQQYERKFADIRAVQDEMVRTLSAKLDVKFSEEERKLRDAERFYEEGRNAWEKRTADAMRRALDSFQQAIQIKPDYAPAYAGIADCYNMLGTYGAERPTVAFPKAKEAAENAIKLDPTMAEGYTSRAFATYRHDWNWSEAESDFKKAIRLDDNNAQAHQWYANLLAAMGRHKEAEEETEKSRRLDPTSLIIQSHFGFIYFFAHRYDDMIQTCQKTLSLDPGFFAARRYLGWAYVQKKNFKEAINQFRLAVSGSNNSPLMRAELAHALASSGEQQNIEEARAILNDLLQLSGQRYISPYHIALIYAALGDKDEAFNWLNRALDERADYLVYLGVDPRFNDLRSDARFQNLVQRIGLPVVNP